MQKKKPPHKNLTKLIFYPYTKKAVQSLAPPFYNQNYVVLSELITLLRLLMPTSHLSCPIDQGSLPLPLLLMV